MKSVLMEQKDLLLPGVQQAVQTILDFEMEECLQVGKHERSDGRLEYWSSAFPDCKGTRLVESQYR